MSLRPVGPVPHADQSAPASASSEGTNTAQIAPLQASTDVQVTTRRDRNAWKGAREIGAAVLHDVLKDRRGSVAAWARRLGIDPSRIADWTGLELSKSPTVADVLLMERDDAVKFLRALVKRLVGEHTGDLRADSHLAVTTAARLLGTVDEALRDETLSPPERQTLATIGDELVALGERLQALRGKR